ncbi:MAG: hypothetical protein QXM00_12880 [Candidatus Bathyarchaeia archaeon]
MLPAGILELLQTPIFFYTIVLTVMWLLIQAISKISHIKKVFPWTLNSKYVYGILTCYIILTLLIIQLDVNIFPYLHAFILALTLWLLTSASSPTKASLTLLTVSIALMPVLVMISTRHPFPLGDDARFPGFAVAIDNDGRWVSYKYAENSYYQFFHLIPALEHILASVTGVGVLNVMSYYLTLKITLYLTYFLLIFLVVEKITGDRDASFIALLLLSITPPLAFTQVTHQRYAIVLFLASTSIVMNLYKRQGSPSRASMLARYPLWLAGIVAHATFAIMFLAFILPIAFADTFREVRRKALRDVGFILIISLTYWIYTYVLDVIVRPTVNAFNRLIELFAGEATPWYGGAQPWYTPESQIFFIAWALVPSIAASHILFSAPRLLFKSHKHHVDTIFVLGFIGLASTAVNYALRSLPTFGGRYFYWLYLLMLPLSALVTRDVTKKFASSILAIILISLASFYGIQDPTLAANTYAENIGWADRVSWHISSSLFQYLDGSETLIWMDPRLSAPLSSLKPEPLYGYAASSRQTIAIVGIDNVGLLATFKDPRNTAWFVRNFGMHPIDIMNSLDEYSVILSSERYVGIWRST